MRTRFVEIAGQIVGNELGLRIYTVFVRFFSVYVLCLPVLRLRHWGKRGHFLSFVSLMPSLNAGFSTMPHKFYNEAFVFVRVAKVTELESAQIIVMLRVNLVHMELLQVLFYVGRPLRSGSIGVAGKTKKQFVVCLC